jgi:predicted RNA methylase
MLTKTLKFDNDTLDVLRDLQWDPDGRGAKITQQLDRKLYEKVNKALTLMGGKWYSKAKVHLFDTDPRASVEGLIDTGTIEVARDGFFETPVEIVKRMIGNVWPITDTMDVLEPSAGAGAILKELLKYTEHVYCVEQNESRVAKLREIHPMGALIVVHGDFMTHLYGQRFDRIVMNPPFEEGQDIDHVQRAYRMLKSGGIMVAILSLGFTFRSRQKDIQFRDWLREKNAFVETLPDDAFKSSGTLVKTVMITLEKE